MPTIGWFEILLIVAVAIIVIGPKDFPFMLKKVGSWIGTTKRYISNIQNEVADLDINSNVLSPTPTVDTVGLSIKVIFLFGKNLIKVAAVIQPAEPPPTIVIFFII